MDEIVRRAMQKWPSVPAVFGWVSLDPRGNWLIRGERISHPLLKAFIGRNYERDAGGRWFFQNGPQRVFVALAYTPWVFRDDGVDLITHTGKQVSGVHGAWIDEDGVLILESDIGAGIVDDRDAELVAKRFTGDDGRPPSEDELIDHLEDLMAGHVADLRFAHAGQRVQTLPIRKAEVASRFNFVADPDPSHDERSSNASVA